MNKLLKRLKQLGYKIVSKHVWQKKCYTVKATAVLNKTNTKFIRWSVSSGDKDHYNIHNKFSIELKRLEESSL